uniref:GHMP family kinase ATP-binding protein n=1 Tax=Candidatus Roseilinea sp. TaxID=2838777 RepID=UPI00404AC0E0
MTTSAHPQPNPRPHPGAEHPASAPQLPLRIVNSVAPTRICDNGGWTDTWFAGYGKIFNIGVYPYVEVQIEVFPADTQPDRIVVYAENYDERFAVNPVNGWQHHPLIEAAIERMRVPRDVAVRVTIFSEMPGGASTGTSAAVAVALVGALDQLTPGRLTPHEVAYIAQSIEVDMLKRQCGIQDQLCAAYGGINFIDMVQYPYSSVSQLYVPNATWWELERRLALIFLGRTHDSSQVHEQVIRELEDAGPNNKRIQALRVTAEKSRDAVYAGDFAALGQAMIENTEAQANLNPALVGSDARRVIEIARTYGAIGLKVNGAGGEGGSVTLLCGGLSHEKRAMIRAIESEGKGYRSIPIYLSRFGLRVWEHAC